MNIKLSQDFILDQLPALDPKFFSDVPVGTIFEVNGGRYLKTYPHSEVNAIKFDRNVPSSWVWITSAAQVYASSAIGNMSNYGNIAVGDVVLIDNTIYILSYKDLYGKYNDYYFRSLMGTDGYQTYVDDGEPVFVLKSSLSIG